MDSERAEYLVERYADLLVRIGRTWLGDWDDAQDVCQMVLIKLLEDPREFPDQGQERAWVVRLAVNQCKNWKKSAWAQRRAPLEEGLARALAERRPKAGAGRPVKRGRMLLVAAVFALGALALTAAALPGFWSMLGVHFSVNESENGQTILYSYIDSGTECPIEVVEGRVWFVFDGQRMDITGQFDEEHAFVYETTNPETGLPNYILVGWSAGGIGYGEIVFLPGETDDGIHSFSAHTLGVVWMDPDHPIFDHTYQPVEGSDWFRNAVEEICAPNLEKIRPAEGSHAAQPSRTGPDSSAPPAGPG